MSGKPYQEWVSEVSGYRGTLRLVALKCLILRPRGRGVPKEVPIVKKARPMRTGQPTADLQLADSQQQ